MRSRLSLAPILALALLVSACATTQVQKSRQVAVDVHATLAAVQDAEAALYAAGTVPAWTQEKHQQFNAHLVIALKAGKALTEGVGTLPIPAGTKAGPRHSQRGSQGAQRADRHRHSRRIAPWPRRSAR
jgi:hypothetical protein